MSKSSFQFKHFSIQQNKCAMKIGTDSVLLGAWCEFKNAKKILDIGTGTGIIALIAAQRTAAQIVGIEIDCEASFQAQDNVNKSQWKERILIINEDITNYVPNDRFDCFISNPPYFESTVLSPNKTRNLARNTSSLSFETLLKNVVRLALPRASFHFVLPFEAMDKFVFLCDCENLFLQRCTKVITKSHNIPKRVLLTFVNYAISSKCDYSQLILMDDEGKHTAEYNDLTRNFYL